MHVESYLLYIIKFLDFCNVEQKIKSNLSHKIILLQLSRIEVDVNDEQTFYFHVYEE